MNSLYIGLMSGTSMDGIDAALVEFGERSCQVVATGTHEYPEELSTALMGASREPQRCAIDTIGYLDNWVGEAFRDAALELITSSKTDAAQIVAIGSHGQTLRHQPRVERPYTLQIGDPNIIVAGTGITTVADFRRRDLALGGEGAPLLPPFHEWLFSDSKINRVVLNIGGIANITVLPAGGGEVTGFDTGPGNTLLDAWTQVNKGEKFDRDGVWARSGNISSELLKLLLRDPYFAEPPPKSTGFEYFNLMWLRQALSEVGDVAEADVQATLCALTARSIADAIGNYAPGTSELLICGGGIDNTELIRWIAQALPDVQVHSTGEFGLEPDWVEAAAFAWLAKRCLDGEPGNLPGVTGAAHESKLGGIYRA
ncbi:MAG: anhydro-N-acetylmuramic acid kinase [Woeseiaceae bacterium]